MTSMPGVRRLLRPWALAALAALLAVLAACGPGVGGSGTGMEPDPAPGGAAAPPSRTLYADAVDGRQVQAELDGHRLRIDAACPALRFDGLWDGRSDGSAGSPWHFDGTLAGEPPRMAVAEVSLSAGTLQLTLRDAAGATLLGPLPLGAVASLPPLAGC